MLHVLVSISGVDLVLEIGSKVRIVFPFCKIFGLVCTCEGLEGAKKGEEWEAFLKNSSRDSSLIDSLMNDTKMAVNHQILTFSETSYLDMIVVLC